MKKKIKQLSVILLYTISSISFINCHSNQEKDDAEKKSDPCCAPKQIDITKLNSVTDQLTHTVKLTNNQLKSIDITYCNIEYKDLVATIKANGNLEVPNNFKANITPLYGGVIKSLYVIIGNKIKKGQVIATLANPQFIQLQEDYLATSNKVHFAEQEFQRQKELYQANASSKKNFQQAESEFKTLQTRKTSLEQQLNMLSIDVSSISSSNIFSVLPILSPINGVVGNVFLKIGSYADASSPIAEIVDNSSIHLDLKVFEKDLPMLKEGQTIHFTLTNNPTHEYDAEVHSIGATFENDSKAISVHCDVLGNKAGLFDGMNITAIVSLANNKMPTVPSEAIVEAEGKCYIFIYKNITNLETEFTKIEVIKGVSNMGHTAITPVVDINEKIKIVSKGAFFINAKMMN